LRIHRHRVQLIGPAAADIREVKERTAGIGLGIELCEEDIGTATELGLVGVVGGREIAAGRVTSHPDHPLAIEFRTDYDVGAAPAEQ
jgi:hypothetical protein